MQRYKNPGNNLELSLLARGTGLMGGGVELECFGEDRRAFTLNGEPFLKRSKSPEGQYAKPYRKCQLALPKTYVTRRGQMVLFTSPEDMMVGHTVVLQHRKEVTSEQAASRLKTVNKLVSSSLGYQAASVKSSEVGEFTPVYLQRLREAAERAKEAENYQALSMEKIDEDMEEDDLEGADSGVGGSLRPSSGRHSSLSHYSDGTVIQIPDGRLAEEEEEGDLGLGTPVDPLRQLADELSGYKSTGQKPKTKSSSGKNAKKRKTGTSTEHSSGTQKQKTTSRASKGKKRKRSKRPQKEDVDGGSKVKGSKVNHLSDIERKKREKSELERRRAVELRERDRLEDELRRLRDGKTELGSSDSAIGSDVWEGGERGGERRHGECVGGGRREERRKEAEDLRWREDDLQRRQTDAESVRQAYEKGAKLKQKANYNDRLELHSLRRSQAISPAYTFSYFRYVPPRNAEGKPGGRGAGTSRGPRGGGQKNKRRKPPNK